MKKYFFLLMFLFVATFSILAQVKEGYNNPYWTEIVTSQPEGYVVDANGDVEISSAEGLAWLISVVNGLNGCVADNFEGRKVELMSDVDLSGADWIPIGDIFSDSTLAFKGLFDGKGHTIRNLFIHDNTYTKHYLGLFGYLFHAEVRGLSLYKGRVIGGSCCGGIAGWSDNGSLVDNCVVNLKAGADFYLGGVVGHNRNSTVRNCCYINDVLGGWDFYSGGIAGWNEANGQDAVIENCYYDSKIEASLNTEYNGGIVGLNEVSDNGGIAMVRNCYAELHGLYKVEGGILGRNLGGVVSYCYYRDEYDGYDVPVIGSGDENYLDCSVFFCRDNNEVILNEPVSIGGYQTDHLLEALNLWRSIQNPIIMFNEWCEGENLPLFCDQFIGTEERVAQLSEITLFPNPTTEIVRIKGIAVTEVQVYNILGQLVKTVRNVNEINLSTLPEGIYLLRIMSTNGYLYTEKVTKYKD